MNIDQKINLLLKESKIDDLLAVDDSDHMVRKSLRIRLKRIIQILFELDHYTMTEWDIDDKKVHSFQLSLQRAFKGLYIKPSLLEQYLSNVLKYMTILKQLRDHVYPDSLDLTYFYYYKSSYIKLIRAIIYNKIEGLAGSTSSDWAHFDLLRAIKDDIDDLSNGRAKFSANRFLFSLARKGHQETIDEYTAFVQSKMNNELSIPSAPLLDLTFDIQTVSESISQQILDLLLDIQESAGKSIITDLPDVFTTKHRVE